MPRASCIYLIYDAFGKLDCAFTVKHEAARYWKKHELRVKGFRAFRIPDGDPTWRVSPYEVVPIDLDAEGAK